MPTHKRLSLAEIAKQDQSHIYPQIRGEIPLRAVNTEHPNETPGSPKEPSLSERRNRKSDFIKISVTLPPAMCEAFRELSHARRKNKDRHMISDFVREALANWLSGQTR